MTITETETITLADLAHAVNRLIDTQPNARNPVDDNNTGSCLYFQPETEMRCLIGEALYSLSGWNVPAEYEEQGIESLLGCSKFRRFFGLDFDPDVHFGLIQAIIDAQGVADGHVRWGSIDKINVDAA